MSQTPSASGPENKPGGPDANPPRAQILHEAAQLITGDRNVTYGSPTQNFTNISHLWNARFGHMLREGEKFTAADVADAMILVKVARNIADQKRDNWLDIAGYAACGYETTLEPKNSEGPHVHFEIKDAEVDATIIAAGNSTRRRRHQQDGDWCGR